jgi:hypothetical protein
LKYHWKREFTGKGNKTSAQFSGTVSRILGVLEGVCEELGGLLEGGVTGAGL